MTTRFAFVAVVVPEGFGLGIAEKDKLGYVPYPKGGVFTLYEDAHGMAKRLNVELGHTPQDAYSIVAASLRRAV